MSTEAYKKNSPVSAGQLKETHMFVKIRDVDKDRTQNGVIYKVGVSGIGVLTLYSYPIGTKVTISIHEKLVATGEVEDLNEDLDSFGWRGLERIGVRITMKNYNWPVI